MDVLYNKYIYDRYTDLVNAGKTDLDNTDLNKIFEWFVALKLSTEYNREFLCYEDIDPTFKEVNKMSQRDTGIDISDCLDTIVQCKLRKGSLTLRECATFFASQTTRDQQAQKTIVRWGNMILARNSDSTLADLLLERKGFDLFIDKLFDKGDIIAYCKAIQPVSVPELPVLDYSWQGELISSLLNDGANNRIICIPTGTGKNHIAAQVIANSKERFLILVPRIILMEQFKAVLIKLKPACKNHIQTIGDGNRDYTDKKRITICVYNSVVTVQPFVESFHQIYIDEAHHIYKPEIYDEDDEDDEETPQNYIEIIRNFNQYKNNVLLSATIDEQSGFAYYKRDIREMIDAGYLTDYVITVPIFKDDPTNRNICEYLVNRYRNVIVYCKSQAEGKQFNNLLNSLQQGCSAYIDCNTGKITRKRILESYNIGRTPFLVNVRVLTEGFDSPITKGVCFIHMPSSQETLIQIIGRALRRHPEKKFASVILPFSKEGDSKAIAKFMRTMAQNDSRIRKSFEAKSVGGYINIVDGSEIGEDDAEANELCYEEIYNSLGVLQNSGEIWLSYLERVKKYIDENKKRPCEKGKTLEEKQLGKWVAHQITNYNNLNHTMKQPVIRKEWEKLVKDPKYNDYFKKSTKTNIEFWYEQLALLKNWINEHSERPADKNNKELSKWTSHQITHYRQKLQIMKIEEIYTAWTNFISAPEYSKHFKSYEDDWFEKFKNVKIYIDENEKRPSSSDKNIEIAQLGKWISHQVQKYKNKSNIMTNSNVYSTWGNFINSPEYKIYF